MQTLKMIPKEYIAAETHDPLKTFDVEVFVSVPSIHETPGFSMPRPVFLTSQTQD
jgi:hypothetical protein